MSLVATYSISFASMAKVVDITGSGVHAAFTILSVAVPGLLFGLLGGVTVDRVSRRTMLIVTNVLRGLVAALAPLYFAAAPPGAVVPIILGVNFLLSAVGQFNFPAEAALIPYLVTNQELLAANSVFNVSYLAAIGFGGGIWGPISVRFVGTRWAYLVGGLLFLATVIPLALMPRDPAPRDRALRRSRYARLRHAATVYADITEGMWFSLHNPAVSVAIVALIGQTALALGMAAVFPVLLSTQFGIALYNLPVFLVPGGIGAGFGFLLLLSALGNKLPRTTFVIAGNALIAAGLLGYTLSIALPGWGVRGLMASTPVIGLGFVVSYISGKSILQEQPPDYLRGRVISLQLTLNNAVSLVPTVLAGWALDVLGGLVVFVASTILFGGLTILCGLWLARVPRSYA